MLTDKEALRLLRQISEAFEEMHRIWDGAIEHLNEAEEAEQKLAA